MGRDFESANPGVKVAFQTIADDDVWTKLLAAFAGGDYGIALPFCKTVFADIVVD